MADDIRTRLSEALDEAEKLASPGSRSVAQGRWRYVGPLRVEDDAGELVAGVVEGVGNHIARWDPSTVLQLVGHFRQLLADEQLAIDEWRHDEAAVLNAEVERAAAFWLGTQEADR